MDKTCGFFVTRRRERRRCFLAYVPRWAWLLAALLGLWILGVTRAWSQSSEWSSSSSGNDLRKWETLSGQFTEALSEQSGLLRQALTELETSKANSQRLTGLLERSSRANDLLRTYNEQIGTRMQQRDEELAAAYARTERLAEQRRGLIIAVVILGAVLAGLAALLILLRRR